MNRYEEKISLVQKLIKYDKSEDPAVYEVCIKLINHLNNSNEHKLTIVGIRNSLQLNPENDPSIIKAAMLLSSQSFDCFDVYFKLYDESLCNVIEELDTYRYLEAISNDELVDGDGNTIDNFQDRLFPYFVYKEYGVVK
ncbi:TPA: hypothetical protein ACX3HW_001911 [Vibrio parahaemolyticus]